MYYAATAAKSLQSCPTLCDPIDGSPPGSPVPGILQTRTLEWFAISFSNAWKWKVKGKSFSCVRLLATPWTAAYQAPLSMGFSRPKYWSGVPLSSSCAWIIASCLTKLFPVICSFNLAYPFPSVVKQMQTQTWSYHFILKYILPMSHCLHGKIPNFWYTKSIIV